MSVRTISSDIAGRLEQAPTSTRSGVSPLPRQSENSVDVRAMSPAPKESSFPFVDQSACPQKAHAKEDAPALPLRAKNGHRPHSALVKGDGEQVYCQNVEKDSSWLSDRRGRCVLTWKRAGLGLARAFCGIVVPTPSADQPLLAVASFRPIASRLAMLLQRHAGRVPSANDLGKAHAARRGGTDFLGKSILSFGDFHPA